MSTYAIDSTAQALHATGVVEPVMEWVEDAMTGRRRPSDMQARAEDNTPLWAVEVSYLSEQWGRLSTVVAKVTVPAPSAPAPEPFAVVGFTGLRVTVTPAKTGGLRESWTADGLPTPARKNEAA